MGSTSNNTHSKTLQAGGSLVGRVRVPGDKSISHRALIFGSIAEGLTTVEGLLPAEDPISTASCLQAMGVVISPIIKGQTVQIEGVGLDGLQVLYVSTSIEPATSPIAAKRLSVLQAKK